MEVITAELKQRVNNKNLNVAFIDFTFNGIYLRDNDINSFVKNYTVKVKVEFSLTTSLLSNINIVDREEVGIGNVASPINQYSNLYWIWILIIVMVSSIIALTAIYTRKTQSKKTKEKR